MLVCKRLEAFLRHFPANLEETLDVNEHKRSVKTVFSAGARFHEDASRYPLKERDAGEKAGAGVERVSAAAYCRAHGLPAQSFYRWKRLERFGEAAGAVRRAPRQEQAAPKP